MTEKKIIQKIVLGGVVVMDGKILILQRHANEKVYPNLWELPSGKREFLESSDGSLKREIKEECNLDVDIVMPCSIFDYKIEKEDEVRDSTQINFIVRPIGGEVVLSDEHQNFHWLAEEEIDNFDITDDTKAVIRKAFKFLLLGIL